MDEAVVSNPRLGPNYTAKDYISQLEIVMKKGKQVFINGHITNPFYKDVNASLAGQYGFKIISEKIPLIERFKGLKFFNEKGIPFNIDQINKMKTTIIEKL